MRPLLLFVCLIAAGCAASADRRAASAPQEEQQARSWSIEVTLASPGTGPITVATRGLRPAKVQVDSRPWMQHELVFRNTGDEPVTFADTRSAKLLGDPPRLVAGDEGCGWASVTPESGVTGACLMYLDPFTVRPHTTVTRTVTLYKELRGMKPLLPGTYVFRRPIRFRNGTAMPEQGEGTSVVLKLRYVVSRS
jgi:hypothetical protein